MKKTLVFGASLKPSRYSYQALKRLAAHGIETVAFGKRAGEVAGIPVSTDPEAFRDIHTVSLYMNPKTQETYYETLLSLKPGRVIFNPGTENPDFASRLQKAGIASEEACTLVLLATGQY